MDERVKALWIDALKSGDYEQGEGRLRRTRWNAPPSYCCLGVLCEIAVKDGLDVKVDPVYGTYNDEGAVLPSRIQEWAGLGSYDGTFGVDLKVNDSNGEECIVSNLISLNDAAGYTFEQIADVINEQF